MVRRISVFSVFTFLLFSASIQAATPIQVDADRVHPVSIVKLVLQPGVKSEAYVASDGLLDELAAEFRKFNYNAKGVSGDSVFESKEKNSERMVLGGKINHLDCTKIAEFRNMFDCNMAIKWELFDSVRDQVIYTVTTRYRKEFYLTKQSTLNELQEMVVASIHSLLSRQNFVTALEKDASSPTVPTPADQPATFKRCDSSFHLPEDLEKVIAATVLVKLPDGMGAGVYVSPDGIVLTAAHVVAGYDSVKVRHKDGSEYSARVIRRMGKVDVALLKVDVSSNSCVQLDDVGASVGADIYGIGAPAAEELSFSVSRGIVSGLRAIDDRHLIQTDASLNPGNSGGPLLNADGKVAAIVVEKISGTGLEGLGFGVTIADTLAALKISEGDDTSSFITSDPPPKVDAVNDTPDPDFAALPLATSTYPHLGYYTFKQKKLYNPGRAFLLIGANALMVGGAVVGTLGYIRYSQNADSSSSGNEVYTSEDEFNRVKIMNVAGFAAAGLGLGLNIIFLATGKSQEKLDAESQQKYSLEHGRDKQVKLGLHMWGTGLMLNGSF